jgi:hypothetical protein
MGGPGLGRSIRHPEAPNVCLVWGAGLPVAGEGTPPWPVGRMEAPSFDAWAALGGAWCPVSLPHKELVAGP